MNNVTNIYDIDGELIRTAGDNHEMTIDEAKEQLKKYEEKVKELTETDPNNPKIVIYNNYIKNLASYILTLYTKQSATINMPKQSSMTDQIKKAMNDLRDEFEKEEVKSQDDMMVEREESSTNMDEYAEFEEVPAENEVSIPFVEVDENIDKEPLPISEIDKIIAS